MVDICPVEKIDSNSVGLAIAEEVCPGILPGEQGYPGTPVWHLMEPNSYSDFGATITTVARKPISQTRSNQKGVVTDLEVTAGFNQDFMLANTVRRMQEFFFASQRPKPTTRPLNGDPTLVTAVTTADGFAVANAAAKGFKANDLVFNSGFAAMANNGVKLVTSASASLIKTVGAVEADSTPNQWASLSVVGHQFAAGDVALQVPVGDFPRLVATVGDFSTMGLIPGEWIFVGGDGAAFQLAGNSGFARISQITQTTLILDKVSWAPTATDGAAKTLRIFFGDVIRNETDPNLIQARSVQLRRTLGQDANGTQSEYAIGAFANEMTVNMPLADKINVDFGYVAMDNVQRTGTQGLKPGTNVPIERSDVFNTSSDFARIKLSLVDPVNGNPKPLFGFSTEMSLVITNNITMNKALGVLGSFSMSAGNFDVSGSITAYFSTVAAVQAVRNNADVTLDLISVKKNTGMLWDIPLLTLGGGSVNVQQDQPVMVPLKNMAAESKFGHTLLFQSFKYLPTLAG